MPTYPLTQPADNAAPYTYTQPIRDAISRVNDLTDPTTLKVPGSQIDWTVVQNTQTGNYTLVLSDAAKVIELNSATAVNLTVPLNSSVAFPIGTLIEILQLGAGQVTVVAAGGGGTTFSEPFTTSLALTWSTVAGGAISVTGGTQGTLSGGSAQVRAEHDVGSADMFTQVNWTAGGASVDSTMGVITRFSSSANTGYLFEVDDFTNFWTFSKVVAGTFTQLGSGSLSPGKPILLRLESQGTSHKLYAAGSLITTISDASITTGQRGGLVSYNPASGGIVFDDFSTGTLAGGGPSVTLTKPVSRALKTIEQGATIGLRKRATDEWVVSGDLAVGP